MICMFGDMVVLDMLQTAVKVLMVWVPTGIWLIILMIYPFYYRVSEKEMASFWWSGKFHVSSSTRTVVPSKLEEGSHRGVEVWATRGDAPMLELQLWQLQLSFSSADVNSTGVRGSLHIIL